jgi:hypothetical protein
MLILIAGTSTTKTFLSLRLTGSVMIVFAISSKPGFVI